MKKNEKVMITVAMIAVFVVGYALGSFLLWPNYDAADTQGSIGKVRKAGQSTESNNKDLDLKLQNDSSYRKEVTYVQSVISMRALQINAAAKAAMEATQNIEEFKEDNQQMKQLEEVSNNALQAIDKSMEALEATLKGNGDGSFENAYRNAINAYMVISTQVSIGDAYLLKVEDFLKSKKKENFQALALSHDLWLTSNTLQAQLNEDKMKENTYGKLKEILSQSEKVKCLQTSLISDNKMIARTTKLNNILSIGAGFNNLIVPEKLYLMVGMVNLNNSLNVNGNLFFMLSNQLQILSINKYI